MGVGLRISGVASELDLGRVVAWLERKHPEVPFEVDEPQSPQRVLVELHPCAEPLELSRGEKEGELVVDAKTSTTGAGYHAYVCEVLDALGKDLSVQWAPADPSGSTGDETGYFHSRDFAMLERVMLDWFQRVLKGLPNDAVQVHVNLPLNAPRYELRNAAIYTPMGPRSSEWVAKVLQDPAAAVDVFPWWKHGKGPEYLLGLALYRMWNDVPWRAPIDDEEEELLQEVADTLEAAESEDPNLPYPWREWHELLELIGEQSEIAERVAERARNAPETAMRIGYRRNLARVSLGGGWSIEVPGGFKTSWDEEGTFLATDGAATVWGTAYRSKETLEPEIAISKERAELEKLGLPVVDWRYDGLAGAATFGPAQGDGETFQMLRSNTLSAKGLMLCTIAVPDEEGRAMAERIWHSLRMREE